MKKTIRLTENELKHLIRESVKRVLNEKDEYDKNLNPSFQGWWHQMSTNNVYPESDFDGTSHSPAHNTQLDMMIYNAMGRKPEEWEVYLKHKEFQDQIDEISKKWWDDEIDDRECSQQMRMLKQKYGDNEKRFQEIGSYYYNILRKAAAKRIDRSHRRYDNAQKVDPLEVKAWLKNGGEEKYERWLGQQMDREAREWGDLDESITRAIRKLLHEEAAGDAVKGAADSALKGGGGDILGSISGDVMQGVQSGEINMDTAKKFMKYMKNYNFQNPLANIKNYIEFFKSLNPTEKKVLIKIALKYGLKLPIK